jgi:hypothetical protein
MRTIIFFLVVFCVYACKENVREKEAGVEWDKLGLDKIKVENDAYFEVHLGGGLCIVKSPPKRQRYDDYIEDGFGIRSCHDSLPLDTVAPTENVLQYRQGGLCFYHRCSIEPEKSFTAFMIMPITFIESRAYRVFASRHSDSTMIYEYGDPRNAAFDDSVSIINFERLAGRKAKSEQPHKEEHIRAHNRQTPFVLFKKYDEFWEELFSIAKPLKTESDYLKKNFYLSGRCNLEFCSTKDILNPLYEVICGYGFESKRLNCPRLNRELEPRCLYALNYMSKKYDILMHNGAFPAGDCDLGNWRYIKIDSLSVEHSKKLKELLSLDDYSN